MLLFLAPEIRRELDFSGKMDGKGEAMLSSNDFTKNAIADATMYLSSHKIGALITIEKHNSLDQYAEKAIQLNSDVSKELLINIFTPNTPLHDGAVIIRGNKIRCAGAYYVLTKHEDLDKTTGSRHRAGLGISEVTDSLTVIVSEETGNISIASEGFMIKNIR
ncbi:MAG: DNA integrity scanning protein DisA nucleotide-binding domain protein [Clostridium sp.]|nr:MAG: DNA integrity scanning protein DisA nucleotide-binding domain protein [Clostridium sp.]